MFNNLEQGQDKTANKDAAVDDIFAETEAPSINNMSNSGNIEAQPAGLAAQPYDSEDKKGEASGGPKVKSIIIMVLAVLIIAALAYLVYAKFLSEPAVNDDTNVMIPNNPPTNQADNNSKNVPPASNPNDNGDFVDPTEIGVIVIPGDNDDDIVNPDTVVTPPADPVDVVEPVTPAVLAPVDSDADSLTDQEETILGTNINLIDSDFDGLSDYEEVKVYGTDPLNADTDGDGYKDGEEVESGHNPLGDGVLQ